VIGVKRYVRKVARALSYRPEDDKISHVFWQANDQSMNILSGQKKTFSANRSGVVGQTHVEESGKNPKHTDHSLFNGTLAYLWNS
jgi:hypothetical protein